MQTSRVVEVREAVLAGSRALVGVAARSLLAVRDDVSLPQLRVLVLLDDRGEVSMGQLADALGVNPSTVTRVCDVLVEKRLIRRTTAPENRRVVCAELTAKGHKLITQVMGRRRALLDEALARLTPDAQRRLARSMAELAEALQESSNHAWALGWSVEDVEVVMS